jgi:hypothetical protein
MQTLIVLTCGMFLGFWLGFLTLAFVVAAKKSDKKLEFNKMTSSNLPS